MKKIIIFITILVFSYSFLKFSTFSEAENGRIEHQLLLPFNYIICPPIYTYDGEYAIPTDITVKEKGKKDKTVAVNSKGGKKVDTLEPEEKVKSK
jgi:hypothetical protein